MILSLPVPFALLCALLFWCSIRAVLIVPAIIAIWIVAYMGAMAAGTEMGIIYGAVGSYLPMCLGGLIGGFGLALCAAIFRGHPRWRQIAGACITGLISALPFGLWLASLNSHLNGPKDPLQPLRLKYAFAIWQAAVGTYFYVSSQFKDADSEER